MEVDRKEDDNIHKDQEEEEEEEEVNEVKVKVKRHRKKEVKGERSTGYQTCDRGQVHRM